MNFQFTCVLEIVIKVLNNFFQYYVTMLHASKQNQITLFLFIAMNTADVVIDYWFDTLLCEGVV